MTTRHKIFFYLALLLVSLLLLRLFYLAGPPGDSLRNEAENIAVYEGVIPAIRGRIFDKSGQLLAWSERCYDLTFHARKANLSDTTKLLAAIRQIPDCSSTTAQQLTHDRVIKYNLTGSELIEADKLCRIHPALTVDLRWERHHSDAEATDILGEVRQINGMEIGISGIELEFEDDLHGTAGKFIVMLDRHGRWLDQTFQIIQNPCNGDDIVLTDGSELEESDHD